MNGKARMVQLRKAFEANRLAGPYVPLARYGNFFVTIRDDQGKVISFSKFEGACQQRAFAEEAEKTTTGLVERGVMSESESLRSQVDPGFVSDVEGILAATRASAEVMDAIWQRWPVAKPAVIAANYATEALESFTRRNPDLASKLNINPDIMREKLAAEIGKRTENVLMDLILPDQLASALRKAGVPATNPKAVIGSGSATQIAETALGYAASAHDVMDKR